MKLYNHIKDLLATVPIYSKEGKLFKNVIVEDGLKLDPTLLKLLLNDERSKKHFFQDVDGVSVFDKTKFQKFISNKEFLPDSFTAFSQNIGLTANGKFLTEANEVVLDFPYKDCVLEGGQTKEDQKRKEIFWNETLAPDEIDRLFDPKALTNIKHYDKDGTHDVKEIKDTDNLIFKGNNLLALHSLKKKYRGKVKLIYIDPPYNTGNDGFDYNDNFNHSTWLTFMKNRLEVAKSLLSQDGTIAISIDHNEIAYMMVLLDAIFGLENRKNIITVKRGSVTGAKVINAGVVNLSEYVVLYSKNSKDWNPNRVYMSKDWDRRYSTFILNYEEGIEKWEFSTVLEEFANQTGVKKSRLKKHFEEEYEAKLEQFVYDNIEKIIRLAALDENAISKDALELKLKSKDASDTVLIMERDNKRNYHMINGQLILFAEDRLSNIDGKDTFSQPATDIWDDVLPNDLHNEGGVTLKKGKKPEKLISRIIELCTDEKELVLDFFAGSGTTGAVSLKLNRQFIICEQLEYTDALPIQRLKNTVEGEQSGISKAVNWQGGGSFVYAELAKNNQNYIDRIQAADSDKELRELYKELTDSHLISYKVSPEDLKENNNEFAGLTRDDQKRFLIKLLDKNELYINYSEMRDECYVLDKDKSKAENIFAINDKFYS
ncbi:site-specific DNA-methyltransferase [uncultured Christiangramia sp.]|uniref:DNA methyltransferase n=1 Tax=Christiangramia sp. 3-2217-3z TaxID=3417564 RepID=UPI002611E0DF|nr:site-specific DNA-methyltransferase [uncultured Christiangramia sp.]